jgi:hypothetical protein
VTRGPTMPEMTKMKGGELAARIREKVLRDMFPAPDKPEFTYINPKWSEIWAELRARCGPTRSLFIIVVTIVLWPFELIWWTIRSVLAIPVVKAILAAAILGGIALWFWNWQGLLVVCLFVWLFTMFRQSQKSKGPQ